MIKSLIGAAALALAAGTAAHADMFEFELDRASLTSPADVERAYEALVESVSTYCAQVPLGAQTRVAEAQQRARCEAQMMTVSIEQIDHGALRALHQTRRGVATLVAGS